MFNKSNLSSYSFSGPGYSCSPARYSKNRMILRIDGDGSGWKTRGMWLAEALGGVWARGHETGYRISPTKSAHWKTLYEAGFDANVPLMPGTGKKATFERGDTKGLTLKEALNLVKFFPTNEEAGAGHVPSAPIPETRNN